ncbi:hypothetical protein OQZ33_13390 [Pedobacter sp. MC2016-05]|uniref:hypothetical protein n=1 Tax=Pedobacter sp. MC2016-05 TaxID=2994474 RepID=UPI002246947D|nr:hypothetical protein [Pedobacter sp. MC2016-05]MCX2475325.1 hypothetical protein [Pedobacter sp. MC2016-05]
MYDIVVYFSESGYSSLLGTGLLACFDDQPLSKQHHKSGQRLFTFTALNRDEVTDFFFVAKESPRDKIVVDMVIVFSNSSDDFENFSGFFLISTSREIKVQGHFGYASKDRIATEGKFDRYRFTKVVVLDEKTNLIYTK